MFWQWWRRKMEELKPGQVLELFNQLLDEKLDGRTESTRDYLDPTIIKNVETYIDFFEDVPKEDIQQTLSHFIELVFYYQQRKWDDQLRQRWKLTKDLENKTAYLKTPEYLKYSLAEDEYFRQMEKWYELAPITMEGTKEEYLIKVEKILTEDKEEEYRIKYENWAKLEPLRPKNPFRNFKPKSKLKPIQKINKFLSGIKSFQTLLEETFGSLNKNGEYVFINPPKGLYDTYKNNQAIIKDIETQQFEIVSKYKFYDIPPASKTPIKKFLQKIRKKYNLTKSLSEKQMIDSLCIGND